MALHLEWDEFRRVLEMMGYLSTCSPEAEAVHRALLGEIRGKNEEGQMVAHGPLVVMAGGEQAGKSFCAGHHIAAAAAAGPTWTLGVKSQTDTNQPEPVYWLVGNTYSDTRREFEYARNALVRTGLTRTGQYTNSKTGPWEIRLNNGALIRTIASEDTTNLAREAPEGIVVCEPGRQTEDAFWKAYLRSVPRRAWVLVAGTFETEAGPHTAWLARLWRQLQVTPNAYHGTSLSLPSYANREMYPQGSLSPNYLAAVQTLRRTRPDDWEDVVAERFLGLPRRPSGMVFNTFSRERHVNARAEFLPGLPVHLAVDPGYAESAFAILFLQEFQGQIRQFDEFYLRGYVNSEAITVVLNHPASAFLETVTIDQAAKVHAGSQPPAIEDWEREFGPRGVPVLHQYMSVQDRNSRIRDRLLVNPTLQTPYLLIPPRCRNTIFEFEEGYRNKPGTDTPIDRDNHAVAALGYYIVCRHGYSDQALGGGRSLLPGPTLTPLSLSSTVADRYGRKNTNFGTFRQRRNVH